MQRTTATERDLPADLGALYAEEGPKLWRALFAYTRDRDIASDALAEAFAQCLRRGSAVRDPRAWVWRSSFRIAAGELSRRRHTSDQMPEEAYEMPEDPSGLLRALSALTPTQRAVLVLRHYVGHPTDEIARTLGMSRATVRVHMSRGRKRLAKRSWRTTMPDLDQRFRSLDQLEAPNVYADAERRGPLPAHPSRTLHALARARRERGRVPCSPGGRSRGTCVA